MRIMSIARGLAAAVAVATMAASAHAEDAYAQRRAQDAANANTRQAALLDIGMSQADRTNLVVSLQSSYARQLGAGTTFHIKSAYYIPQGNSYIICGTAAFYNAQAVGGDGTFVFQPGAEGYTGINVPRAKAQALGCFSSSYVTLR